MEKSNGTCSLVYDFYEARILFGYYRDGDKLPSISDICKSLRVGRATARAALFMLAEAGYIRTEERRATRVCYKAGPGRLERNAAEYFVPRQNGLLELNEAGRLLLVPLWEAGVRSWDRKQWEALEQALSRAPADNHPLFVELYVLALEELDNRLALNLYWEIIRYIRIPALLNREKVKAPIQDRANQEGVNSGEMPSCLGGVVRDIYLRLEEKLFAFIRQGGTKYGLESAEQIPFRWNIYRQRPQLRYTLSSLLIREIVHGRYPIGTYLPSLPELEKQYCVSLATVRRTLALLEEMGVIRSFQGKGIRVCMERRRIDTGNSDIQEGLRLCRESLQLLALTIRGVSSYTLSHASEGKRKGLAGSLRRSLDQGQSYYCFEIMLAFIKHECPLDMVRECYGTLGDLVAWGYPFVRLMLPEDAFSVWVERMEQHLRDDNVDAFSGEWEALMRQEEQRYIDFMQSEGSPEDRLVQRESGATPVKQADGVHI